jgi:hypothetical protein
MKPLKKAVIADSNFSASSMDALPAKAAIGGAG